MKKSVYESHRLEDTAALATTLARTLAPGQCITLEGDLGAGKTTFVRSLVEALGGDPRSVSSPTFMLLNIYPTPMLPVFHLDAYRVHGGEDFEAIGFSELFEQGGVVIVEWASRVIDLIPSTRIAVRITHTGDTSRRFEIEQPQ